MENNFICPKCQGYLNIASKIIFTVKSITGDVGLIFLSPKVGDYSVERNSGFDYNEGAHLHFSCPLCSADLTAHDVNKNLATIIMIDKIGEKHTIIFSMIAGERCTYKITEDKIETFGESSSKYLNFINLSLSR